MLCTTRAFQRLRNNLVVSVGAAIGNLVMAIIVGSVFFNLEETTESFLTRGILIFFAVLLNGCMGAFEV
jgi:ATP-binding cassette subfamily G (WHITE) protein 2 (PDR)